MKETLSSSKTSYPVEMDLREDLSEACIASNLGDEPSSGDTIVYAVRYKRDERTKTELKNYEQYEGWEKFVHGITFSFWQATEELHFEKYTRVCMPVRVNLQKLQKSGKIYIPGDDCSGRHKLELDKFFLKPQPKDETDGKRYMDERNDKKKEFNYVEDELCNPPDWAETSDERRLAAAVRRFRLLSLNSKGGFKQKTYDVTLTWKDGVRVPDLGSWLLESEKAKGSSIVGSGQLTEIGASSMTNQFLSFDDYPVKVLRQQIATLVSKKSSQSTSPSKLTFKWPPQALWGFSNHSTISDFPMLDRLQFQDKSDSSYPILASAFPNRLCLSPKENDTVVSMQAWLPVRSRFSSALPEVRFAITEVSHLDLDPEAEKMRAIDEFRQKQIDAATAAAE